MINDDEQWKLGDTVMNVEESVTVAQNVSSIKKACAEMYTD